MARIEPSSFDVIVLGSGLVECLVASALTRAGKSVLLVDQTDVYGSDFSSFTIAGLLGSSDPSANPHAVQPSGATEQVQLPEGIRAFKVPRPALPISGLEVLCRPGASIGNERSYILDLAPKVIYQAEHLVDVLLRTRAHNYLEFKAVDCSFILQGGALSRVPASRADVFKDRKLGLADKRQLMAFISAAMDGAQGLGRLAAAMASTQPLARLLASEGLSPGLAATVLYGIAMAWSTQAQQPAEISDNSSSSVPYGDVSASQGAAMLALFTSSLGKFGSQGAFMFPSYGCGSVAEALVRHSAVHGAVTALRQPVTSVLVGPRSIQVLPEGRPSPTTDAQPGSSEQGGAPCNTQTENTGGQLQASGQSAEQSAAQAGQGAAPVVTADAGGITAVPQAAQAGDGAPVVRGILCEGGQVLECRQALVAGARVLRPLLETANSPSPLSLHVARAIAVLDGPLAGAESMSTLMIPPGSQGVDNDQPIQGLLLSPSALVSPSNKWLLYLSTPLGAAPAAEQSLPSARTALHTALSQLADCSGLEDATAVEGTTQPVSAAAASQAVVSTPSVSVPASAPSQAAPTPAPGSTAHPASKPAALRAFFYTQELCCPSQVPADAGALLAQIWEPSPGTASTSQSSSTFTPCPAAQAAYPDLPPNAVLCPGADPSLFGYVCAVAEAQALVKAHFPGVTWLGDLPRPGAEETGAAVEEDGDAVDDLTAALQALAGQQAGAQSVTEN